MLAFVTSMRHPDNADDYAYNETLLRQTLRSIEQQTSAEYVVYIVGNKEPSFRLPERMHFVRVDFDPPERVHGPHADRSGFVRDKGTKIGVGLVAAKEHRPDWVMIFDADDFIHRDLVRFVHDHQESAGWVIEKGWIYSRLRNGYRKQDSFNGTCGTSFVIPFDVYNVSPALTVDSTQEELIASFGEVLPSIMGAHRDAVHWHRQRGRDLASLPFRGAVYHVDTGENHSRKALPGLIRMWSPRLERDFAIPTRTGRLETLWSCMGPTAVRQSFTQFSKRALRAVSSRVGRGTTGSKRGQ